MVDNIYTRDELNSKEKVQEAEQIAKLMNDEEKAIAKDQLEEKAEALNTEGGKIPEKFMELDSEIQRDIQGGFMDIGVNHPYLKTSWVNYVNVNGQMVWKKKAEGWQIATIKDFPEAKHLRREDSTIRIGDVLLMSIRIDEYLKIQQKEEAKRLRQQYGIETEISNLAAKHPDHFKFYSDNTGGLPESVEKRINSRTAMAGATRSLAAKAIGNKMKKGVIPGVPIK